MSTRLHFSWAMALSRGNYFSLKPSYSAPLRKQVRYFFAVQLIN